MLIRDTNINVDRDLCIACGICVDRCVMDNLRLSVAPCRQSCPLHINCQGFIRLVAQGRKQQAIELLSEFWPFLDVLSLLCHAPCEKACARKKVDRSVNIRALYRYIAEKESEYIMGASQQVFERSTGKKVAIWGSGPAAMMVAWRLGRLGHQIVMFEPEKEPGAVLRDYSATSKLQMETIRTLVVAITATGIDLKTGIDQFIIDELFSLYDAVIITYKDDRELLRILDHNGIEEESFKPDPRTLQVVEQKRVFICKEFSSGKSRLVNALAIGKTASESVHRFLSGVPLMWERGFWQARGNVKDYVPPYDRAKHVQPEDNKILRSYTKEEALFEAERCLGCGRPFDHNHTCWYCLPCELECPHDAIEVRIPYLLR